MTTQAPTPRMYTHKGESFNIPALLRRLKAETADSYDSGVRNLGGMLARLIEAQQSELATSEAKLKEARKWMQHKTDCEWVDYGCRSKDDYPCNCGLDAFLASADTGERDDG